jgi:hypothetical protein
MRRPSIKRPALFRKLNAPYRVVLIDNESLEEVAVFNLTKRVMYMLLSTLFVMTVFITVLILLYTPLKYYIPGYGSTKNNREVVRLRQQVDSMGYMLGQQQKYAANIKAVINGDYDGKTDTTMLDMAKVRTDQMNSIIPNSKDIKQQAMVEKPKEPEPAKKKRRRRR